MRVIDVARLAPPNQETRTISVSHGWGIWRTRRIYVGAGTVWYVHGDRAPAWMECRLSTISSLHDRGLASRWG